MRRTFCALVLLATGFASAPAMAQSGSGQPWPSKTLKIVVINAPGGLPDIAARVVANNLSKPIGQAVVVENRPGAGGNIAALYVAKAPPDGHTLLLNGFNQAVNPTLLPNPGFDYEKDLAPVTMIAEGPMLLLASPTLPANNVAELVALAKRKPASLSMAIAPIGSPNHIGAELLSMMAGADIVMVMYQGIAPAMPDMVAGRVDIAIAAIGPGLPFVKAGKLKALAVTTLKRTSFAPEVPTATESGLPGFDLNTWVCMMVTGGTPKPIVSRLNAEIRKVMALPEVRESLVKQGAEPSTSTPEELGALIKAEAVKWAAVLKNAKLKQ
jgi:tripartite-type tricarboxylate transporter receptor subunit TctC